MELSEYTPEMLSILGAAPNCIVRKLNSKSPTTITWIHSWSSISRNPQFSMRLLKVAVRRILLVSAEMTTSWLKWSKQLFESATALIKTVCEQASWNTSNALGNWWTTLYGPARPKLFIESLLTPSVNSNIASCSRVLLPAPTFIKWKSTNWNNCYSCCHDACLDSLRDSSFSGKKGVGCEIRPGRSMHTISSGMKIAFNFILEWLSNWFTDCMIQKLFTQCMNVSELIGKSSISNRIFSPWRRRRMLG